MKRKLIAVAVAGVMGVPASFAVAQSTVQIYGRAHVEYSNVRAGGMRTDQMSSAGGQHIGFRGTESLGGGLNAWFQCETGLNFQTGFNGDGFCTRNSAVGFRGGFGNIQYGNWDLPMKWASISGIKHGDTGVIGTANLLHKGAPGSVRNGSLSNNAGAFGNNMGVTSFYRRQAQTVQYWTPNMSGFEGRVGVSAANEENNTTVANRTPRTWSFAGKYTAGPLLLSLGYERHKEYLLANRDDKGWIVGAAYRFGPVRLSGLYERLNWESFNAAQNVKNRTWALFADWRLAGPHSLQFQYVRTGDMKANFAGNTVAGTNTTLVFGGDTGAKQYGIRYSHDFSKRTAVRVNYTHISNDTNARYGIYAPSSLTPNAGERARGIGLSVDHRF